MIVGLTGGIGSGKSTVAKMFMDLGVPVYLADDEAKKLLSGDPSVRKSVEKLLGKKAYIGDKPDRAYIASQVFDNSKKLESLNKIIHPAVRKHFKNWYTLQVAPYVIKEAAILFESGSNDDCDAVITVTAPPEIRIERVILRDHTTEEAVKARMKHQWSDEEKLKLSDFVITNTSLKKTQDQVRKIHGQLLKKLS
jgi:dephospho-CoA kinase